MCSILLVKLHIIIFITTMFLPLRLFKLELKRSDCFKQYLQYNNAVDKLDRHTWMCLIFHYSYNHL